MRVLFSPTGVLVLLLLTWLPVTAQESTESDQPDEAKVSLSGEIKIFNDLVIPQGEVRSGNIRVIGGNLTVAGRVTGRITVLGGDVDLQPTAQVEGAIVALGGKISRSDEAQVTGDVLEVNRGKVSLTREESRQIFGYDEDQDERLDWRSDEDEEDEWVARDVDSEWPVWRPYARRRTRPDFEVTGNPILRYNRAEGLALYIPFHPDTDDIPGFDVYGFVGRAFGAQQWYGRIGIGEYFWRGRIGFLVEGHREPRHNDGWRVTPKENSLGAFLIHRDWYDWYETEGFGGSFVLGLPPLVEFKVRYRDEVHRIMRNATEWSLFNKDQRFDNAYSITEGNDVNLQYLVTLGRPVDFFPRRIQGNLSYAYTQTLDGSAFDYTRDDITLEAFVPLHRRLGIRLNARTGAVYGDTTDYGPQHLVPIGGIGSVQGYDYKEFIGGDHYAVINATFSLRERRGTRRGMFSLHWHFGLAWDSQDRLLTGDYFADLQKDGYHAVGISIGNDDARIELFRPLPLTDGRDWVFYLRLLDF